MPFNTNRRALVVRARHFSPFPRYAVSILREKAEGKGLTRSSKFNRIAPNVLEMLNKHAQTIGSIIFGKGTRVFQSSSVRLISPLISNWCSQESFKCSPINRRQNCHSEYIFQGCQSPFIKLENTCSIQRFGTADPNSGLPSLMSHHMIWLYRLWRGHGNTVDSRHADEKTPLHLAASFDHIKAVKAVKASWRSGCNDVCHGAIGKMALYCTAIKTRAPIIWLLLSSEASKSKDYGGCGLALRCIKVV